MREWIVGLMKAAQEKRAGASAEELGALAQELGVALPEELAEVYAQLNGADFPGEVTLFGLRQSPEATGILEESRAGLSGLPARGAVRFGLRGGGEHLFAALKDELEPFVTGRILPGWFGGVPRGVWVYGVKNIDTGELRLYPSLSQMLGEVIPPASAEGFGENTFVRAMNVVQSALGELAPSKAAAKKERTPKKPAAKRAKAPPKKKAAARAKAKPAAKKKAAARKPAKKAPAKKKR